ncbi:MAG TPA: tetratricopeptide repeat protein [Sedimentisphaerales bacterium]|nr:tetratricopeptide repeat protein [Sedimentisphaerales bacterium]
MDNKTGKRVAICGVIGVLAVITSGVCLAEVPGRALDGNSREVYDIGGGSNSLEGVIERTLEECRKIPNEIARGDALYEMAKVLVNTGDFDRALQVTLEQSYADFRSLSYIATRQAHLGLLEAARATAYKIDNKHWQQNVLVDVARAYMQAGKSDEALVLLKSAREIATETERIECLANIGLLYAQMNKPDLAREAFRTAVLFRKAQLPSCKPNLIGEAKAFALMAEAGFIEEVIGNVTDSVTLGNVADELIASGRYKEAELISLKCDVGRRAYILSLMAHKQAEENLKESALANLKMVEELISEFFPKDRVASGSYYLEIDIAASYARLGELSEAMRIVESIRSNTDKIGALTGVARWVREDEAEGYKVHLQEALKVANEIPDPYFQSIGLYQLALAHNEQNDSVSARQILKKAAQVTDYGGAIGVLSGIASAQVQVGGVEGARETYARAVGLAKNNATRLEGISNSMARSGLFKEALAVARQVEFESVRRGAYAYIAEHQVRKEGVDRTLMWIANMDDAGERAGALAGLTSGLEQRRENDNE